MVEILLVVMIFIFILGFIQAFARIENHYFVNRGFFPTDSFLLDNVGKIRHINTTIVQVTASIITGILFSFFLETIETNLLR